MFLRFLYVLLFLICYMTIAAQWGWARKGDMCTGEWKLWQAPRPRKGEMRTWPLPLAVRKGQYEKIGHSYSRVIPPSWVGAQLGFHTDAKKNLFASLAPLWQVACTHVQVCSYNLLFSMFLCSMFSCSYVQVYSYVRTHMLWHTYVWLNGSVCTSALCVCTHGWGRSKTPIRQGSPRSSDLARCHIDSHDGGNVWS